MGPEGPAAQEPGARQPAAGESVTDSPTGWVADHIRDYVATGGASGHLFQGVSSLLVTTRGRRSGRLRRTALFYGRDGDRYVVVASNGGSPRHPQWYLNLVADPEVEVQVGPQRFRARASTAGPQDKPALWELMVALFPPYEQYRTRTDRDIPVVVLERL